MGNRCNPPLGHSNLTRTRERFGLSVFRCFFEEIVERCAEAGLVRGRICTSTRQGGGRQRLGSDSMTPRFAVEEHLDGLFEAAKALR